MTSDEPDPMRDVERPQPELLDRSSRLALNVSLITVACIALAYRLLTAGNLGQGTVFFVGLPLLFGLLTVNLTRTKSPWGAVVRGNIIFLMIVAPMLGEGAICLLMASPLFIGITLLWTALLRSFGSFGQEKKPRHRALSILLLPVLWDVGEQQLELMKPRPEIVRTRVIVEGDAATWRVLVRGPVLPAANHSMLLRLGFPIPIGYSGDAEVVTLRFAPTKGVGGEWRLARRVTADGIDFELLEDTTKIAGWLDLVRHRVEVRPVGPAGGNRVELLQETTFVPLLSPLWYFLPIERTALRAAQELAIRTWQEELARRAATSVPTASEAVDSAGAGR